MMQAESPKQEPDQLGLQLKGILLVSQPDLDHQTIFFAELFQNPSKIRNVLYQKKMIELTQRGV
jgi:hypothetical protein